MPFGVTEPAVIPMQRIANLDRLGPEPTQEQATELVRCSHDFWYWAGTYAKILDKSRGEHGEWVPFDDPRPCQRDLIDSLLAGDSNYILKSRRPGITTAGSIWMLWNCQFRPPYNCDCVSKTKYDAMDVIAMYKGAEVRQPRWMQQPLERDTTQIIKYLHGSSARVVVAGKGAARSQGIDFIFFDECAFYQNVSFEDSLKAAIPALELSRGNWLAASTSDGPDNGFARQWKAFKLNPGNCRLTFLSWRAHPRRDAKWYEETKAKYAHIPNYMKQEYPNTEEEAFEMAGGRVYPHISPETHFVHFDRPDGAHCYRGLDFGTDEHHPCVCVWLWHDESASPALTFEPDCEVVDQSPVCEAKYPYGFDELFAYRRHEDTGQILKDHDHIADAIRYPVTSYTMTGHVHVYRVLVVRPDDYMPSRPLQFFWRVMELSGWEKYGDNPGRWRPGPHPERYKGSVGDPVAHSWKKIVEEQQAFGNFDFYFTLYSKPKALKGDEREAGVAWISALLGNAKDWLLERVKSAEELRDERARRKEPAGSSKEKARRTYRHAIQPQETGMLYGYGG